MAPARRHVHLTMEKNIYKKLGNHADIEKAWNLTRCSIGEEIFGRDFVSVPQIKSAPFYNQLFVFKKQTDHCRLGKPRYKIVNNLDNLLNINDSTWIPQFDFEPWNETDSSFLCTNFSLTLQSSYENPPKSVEVSIYRPHIRNASPPIPGSTTLRPSLGRFNFSRGYTLYVITSVVYASFVKISVRVGLKQNNFIKTQVIPIGFKYQKFKLRHNGVIEREVETSLKYSDNQATWLSPQIDLFLRMPLWDPMRRRHDGRRPMRNILTLCTAHAQYNRRMEHRYPMNQNIWITTPPRNFNNFLRPNNVPPRNREGDRAGNGAWLRPVWQNHDYNNIARIANRSLFCDPFVEMNINTKAFEDKDNNLYAVNTSIENTLKKRRP